MTKHVLLLAVASILVLDGIVCPPVTDKPSSTPAPDQDEDVVNQLAYQKYLREVMSLLMADKDFAKQVIEAGPKFSRKSGEIARHLDFVGHGIRTQLDEIKRKEVDRLRQIIRLQMKLQHGTDDDDDDDDDDSMSAGDDKGKPSKMEKLSAFDRDRLLSHLDHSNPNTFEVEDLSRLIRQATKDLEDIDTRRRQDFKNYEMEKEHLRRKELDGMDAEKRAAAERKYEELKKKHSDHPKLHHPGNEEQLKEVWEETDGLNKNEFDPRTFFHLHDANSDGQLDETELEALFQKELDKAYDPKAPEDDMVERYEEMNRMREHVLRELDKNGDRMISVDEFVDSTKQTEFKKDEAWDTLDREKVFTDEELAAFEKQYEELQRQQKHLGVQLDGVRAPADGQVNVMNQESGNQQQTPRANEPILGQVMDQAVNVGQRRVDSVQQPYVEQQHPVVQQQQQSGVVQEQQTHIAPQEFAQQQHVVQQPQAAQQQQQQPDIQVQQPVVQQQPGVVPDQQQQVPQQVAAAPDQQIVHSADGRIHVQVGDNAQVQVGDQQHAAGL